MAAHVISALQTYILRNASSSKTAWHDSTPTLFRTHNPI